MTTTKRAVVLLSQDPTSVALADRIKAAGTAYHERRKFLEKQIEDLTTTYDAECKPIWTELEEHLFTTGALKRGEYDTEKDNLHIDRDVGVIYTYPVAHGGLGCGDPDCRMCGKSGLAQGLFGFLGLKRD